MPTLLSAASSVDPAFVADVRAGLGVSGGQKWLPSVWLYDELGSALFEAITLLPEYGLTRADDRLLRREAASIAAMLPDRIAVAELGSGSGKKTRALLEAIRPARYHPIDVSEGAQALCVAELQSMVPVEPVTAPFLAGLDRVAELRRDGESLLVLFLGSTIGNFDRTAAGRFLREVNARLRPGDRLLLGADLIKPVPQLLAAYDDATGVTAAFNRNVLTRLNREMGANFDSRRFGHQARFDAAEGRVEMHLCSDGRQTVEIPGAGLVITFADGESIWTESSHKYTKPQLRDLVARAGFEPISLWVDEEWPFAEMLCGV